MHKEYEVIQPPDVKSMSELINKHDSRNLSSLAIKLVVREQQDELASRRSPAVKIEYLLNVETMNFGGSPFINGHLDNNPQLVAHLAPVNEKNSFFEDKNRPLHLSVYEADTFISEE